MTQLQITTRAEPEPGVATTFRVLDTSPAPGSWNMAVDLMLMARVRAGELPVLRFYRWSPACLSLGRNQPARGAFNESALADHGLDVVRRPTGGRAVLHDRELTYSVVMPARAMGSARRAYATINRALVAGLRLLGVRAELQPRLGRRALAPSLSPCFADPAEGEVVVGARKLVGSAQCHRDGVLLQHGSLLLEDSQALVRELLCEPPDPTESPATLSEILGAVPRWEDLTAALVAGWHETVGGNTHPQSLNRTESAEVLTYQQQFDRSDWTWRL